MMNQAERFDRFKVNLNGLYVPKYEALCEYLAEIKYEDGSFWAPYCGIRSANEQDFLYAIGRTRDHKARRKTQAQGWESPHNYGCASDWTKFYPDGKARWDHEFWVDYINGCQQIGLVCGATWKMVDKPHNELKIGLTWAELKPVVLSQGSSAAFALIKAAVK